MDREGKNERNETQEKQKKIEETERLKDDGGPAYLGIVSGNPRQGPMRDRAQWLVARRSHPLFLRIPASVPGTATCSCIAGGRSLSRGFPRSRTRARHRSQ